ncbi:MAG: MSCRAMM family protein [Blastocatellia bacterium]
MMKSSRMFGAINFIVLAFGFAHIAHGQENLPGKIKLKDPPASTSSGPNKPRKENYKNVAAATTTKSSLVTGSLSVVAASGATVYLDYVDSQSEEDDRKGQIPAGRRQAVFNDLKPGRYRVSFELAGFEDAGARDGEREVLIKSNRTESLEFNLRPITYDVLIKTNVKTGEVRFKAHQGDQIIRRIQDGRIALAGLSPGKYEIEISAGEFGFEPLKDAIEVGPGKTEFEALLKGRLSEEALSSSWTTLEGWETPAGWSVKSGRLFARGPGVALPSDRSVRHYADFEMSCSVRMSNDIAASFVLRAQDNQNYYLVQITGGQANEHHVLRGFVIKQGVAQRLQNSITIPDPSISTDFFQVVIKCVRNKISVTITTPTGAELPLGELTDVNRHFSDGAPGFAVRDQEQMEVGFLHVKPLPRNDR